MVGVEEMVAPVVVVSKAIQGMVQGREAAVVEVVVEVEVMATTLQRIMAATTRPKTLQTTLRQIPHLNKRSQRRPLLLLPLS
jgi:translation initiation factor 2 gamma subunit (eIF-2gamma)